MSKWLLPEYSPRAEPDRVRDSGTMRGGGVHEDGPLHTEAIGEVAVPSP
jgi:hypothetical protein